MFLTKPVDTCNITILKNSYTEMVTAVSHVFSIMHSSIEKYTVCHLSYHCSSKTKRIATKLLMSPVSKLSSGGHIFYTNNDIYNKLTCVCCDLLHEPLVFCMPIYNPITQTSTSSCITCYYKGH